MLLEHVVPEWVQTVVSLLLIAAIIVTTGKNKWGITYTLEVVLAIWYFAVGMWILGLVWVVLISAVAFMNHRKEKAKAAKIEAKRREDESVANSAGAPDSLPY